MRGCLCTVLAHLAGCGVLELQEEALCPQGCGGLVSSSYPHSWRSGCSFQPGAGLVFGRPAGGGEQPALVQAEWGLQHTRPPPQGQWMGGRDVRLVPAPDASHSPALSSWFLLLGCLGEGSHAEQVSGAGQQLSLSQGWLCLRPMLKV